MEKIVNLVFPHQLFEKSPLIEARGRFLLVESDLYFNQFDFHFSKLVFQRASMKFYEGYLQELGFETDYVEANVETSEIRTLVKSLSGDGISRIRYIDPVDDWLSRRLERAARKHGVETEVHDSPAFINTRESLSKFFREDKKKFYQTAFYKDERRRLGVLIDSKGDPEGGKWTFDTENRKKYPAKKTPPGYSTHAKVDLTKEATEYVSERFPNAIKGSQTDFVFPFTHKGARDHLEQFLERRFEEFGAYEDAIVSTETTLNHSLLSPLINAGLITPLEVIDKIIAYASDNDIPINSTEGFIRQVIGWREFIRGVYVAKGRYQRTKNYWGFDRKIPGSFYDGTTGILPLDDTIKKVLKTGYCHHIERLMIVGNFMMLCEFDPDEVYRWFMEMFVDAYDWVMVPNVYGMSQYSDGGLMTTKPYISGSNYIIKMSDYKKEVWCAAWDGLFWRFLDKHIEFFSKNPRMRMLVSSWNRMSNQKRKVHLKNAEEFLVGLG